MSAKASGELDIAGWIAAGAPGGFVRAARRPGGEGGVLRHRRRSVERSGRGGPSRLPERGVSRRRRGGGGGATLPARPCPSPRPGARETVGRGAGGRRAVPHRLRAYGGEGVLAPGFPRRGPLEGPRRSGLACRDRRRFRPRRGNGGSPRGGRVACASRRHRTDFLAGGERSGAAVPDVARSGRFRFRRAGREGRFVPPAGGESGIARGRRGIDRRGDAPSARFAFPPRREGGRLRRRRTSRLGKGRRGVGNLRPLVPPATGKRLFPRPRSRFARSPPFRCC